jgi:prepilin-type N-terminal cleavage/methylation domain-containing protein
MSVPHPFDRNRNGFTLIELLVVITIIVVLLALLMPAMNKAIYQAELVLCGTRQHAIAVGAQSYALNNRRHYPDRILPGSGPSFNSNSADTLFSPAPAAPPERDLRKMIGPYMDINRMLNDALTRPVDFQTTNESWCYVSYYMYFGYAFRNADFGGRGMMKLGDRWTFTSPDDLVTRNFRLMVVDADKHHPSQSNLANSAHPDRNGVLVNVVWQGQTPTGSGESPAPMDVPGLANAEFILSRWSGGYQRSEIDMNAALDDGSVERFNDVGWQAGAPDPAAGGSAYDPRFTRVFHGANDSNFVDNYLNVPIR